MKILRIFFSLIKIKIALAITFTTFTAYIIFSKNIDANFFYSLIGVLLMSSGALALNQCQERLYDSKMSRTKNRPLPNLEIKNNIALIISLSLIIAGSFVLLLFTNYICASLGLFNVSWYNIVYTYLKRLTVFAVVPGALVGVVPAFIGWCAAGGSILDLRIMILSLFLFLWQIPHFWLILFYYNSDYKDAGFPAITNSFSISKIKTIVFVWIIATCFSTLLLPVYNLISSQVFVYFLVFINIITIFIFYSKLLKSSGFKITKVELVGINIYYLIILLLLIINSFVNNVFM